MRAIFAIAAFVTLLTVAHGAPKYITSNTLTNVITDAAAGYTAGGNEVGGLTVGGALEWFRFPDATNQFAAWQQGAIGGAVAGSLPGPSDDVVIGWRPTVAAPTTGIFMDYGNPKTLCATGAGSCFDTNVPTSAVPRNTTISSLTLQFTTTGSTLTYPVVFTGFPQISGVYVIANPQTGFSVTGSLFLRVLRGVHLATSNTAIYGTGYGVNLGGASAAAAAADAAAGSLGLQTFSAADFGMITDTAANTLSGRNSIYLSNVEATAGAAADIGMVKAQLNKYGFILATPSIYVNPCGLGCGATEYGASNIAGPNLFIQPNDNSTYALAAPPLVQSSSSSPLRVNITIASTAVLFTTAVNYINADFYIRSGGILAFCEPLLSVAGTTAGGATFQNLPILRNAGAKSSATGGSYAARANIVTGTNGQQGATACNPVQSVAYDWFGLTFTSVRIFNSNAATLTSILYSEVSPNLAKLIAFLGKEWSVPVLGNITITMAASGLKEFIPVGGPVVVTDAIALGDPFYTGRVITASAGATAALGVPQTVVSPISTNQGIMSNTRGQSFLGAAFPINPFYTATTVAQSIYSQATSFPADGVQTVDDKFAAPQAIPFVTSWDCSRAWMGGMRGSNAGTRDGTYGSPSADTTAAENAATTANGPACAGLPKPTRFTFFGGVAKLTKAATATAEVQFLALDSRSHMIAGDGTQSSVITIDQFTQQLQLSGLFGARRAGAWLFNGVTLMSAFTNVTNNFIRTTGQSYSAHGPATAAGVTLHTVAGLNTEFLVTPSSVYPTQYHLDATNFPQFQNPVLPVETNTGTSACFVLTQVQVALTRGTGCTAGDYSYLFTIPPVTAAIPNVKRPAVLQVFCSGGVCGQAAILPKMAAGNLITAFPASDIGVRIYDQGCYSLAADADMVGGGVAAVNMLGNGALPGQIGFCAVPPTVQTQATDLRQVGSVPTGALATIVRYTNNITEPQLTFQGFNNYPSMEVANFTAGQFILNAGGTVNQRNFTVASSALVVATGAQLSVARFLLTPTSQVESSLKISRHAVLNLRGTLTTTALGSASNVELNNNGRLSVEATATIAGANIFVNAPVSYALQPVFQFLSGTSSVTGINVFSGNGTVTFGGSTTVSGTVTSSLSTTILSAGQLLVSGTYTQTSGNITVSDNSIISTSGAGVFALTGSADLLFSAGAVGSGTTLSGLTVTLANAANLVIVSTGASVTARGTLTVTWTPGTTAVQVFVLGTLTVDAINSALNANVNVQGTLATTSAANSLTLQRTTRVISGTIGSANSKFTIGAASNAGILTITGTSFMGGIFDLPNANSFVSNAGTTTLNGATQITTSLVAPSTTSATTDGSTMALFNSGTLTLPATLSTAVDIVNSGTISVSAGQALTIPAARNLRLRAGTVSGSGTLTINGNVFTDSGANSLVPSSIVNNGVITVNTGSTLVLTTCITGSGTLIAGVNQVTFTSTGASCFNLNTATTIQSLNTGLAGTTTPVGSGLLVITGTLSGQGAVTTTGSGLISLNNNVALTLTVTASSTVGTAVASSTDAITVSGTICVNAGVTFSLGASTVGTRATTTPFALTTSGVTATFSCAGTLNLLGALTVQSGAGLTLGGGITVTGTGSVSVASGASMTISGAVSFNGPSLTIVGSLVGTNTAVLTLGAGTTLTLSSTAQLRDITIAGAGNVVVNGAVVVPSSVTISTSVQVTGSITASNGATLTFSGLVVCINSAQVLGSTTNPQGKVIINGNAIGCTINQNVQLGANGQLQGVITFGGQIITLGTSTIFANANVTFTTPTYLNCPTGTVCVVDFGPTTRLIILFNFACLNIATGALVDGQINCPNPGTLATAGNVRVIIRGVLVLGAFTTGARMAGNVAVQDQFTFPIATFGQLILTDPSITVINAQNNVLTGSSQLNPTIIINDFTMAGTLIVNTQNFVPLHPTILFRSLNGPVSGRFANIIVNSDTSRSLHPWAWNIGTPTVRYVGRDVVLDPTGNGVNAAAGVAPSFLIALFAVVAAFFMRN